MFDQIKDLYKLKKQAEELQKQMGSEFVSGASRDGLFTLTLNGNHELVKVEISPEAQLTAALVEKNTKEAFGAAEEKLKKVLADKFRGMM